MVGGAPGNDDNDVNASHICVYHLVSDKQWVQMRQTLVGESSFDYFGSSVALLSDSRVLVVGVDEYDFDTGCMYVY